MIALPPGCRVVYPIWIDIKEMTNDILDWYKLIGGTVTTDHWYNHRGQKIEREYVQFGKSKRCHYMANGSGGIRLHFNGEDASVASMFILKFSDIIEQHNLKEQSERVEREAV